MTDAQVNVLINLLATVTLFEMMVTVGLGVSFAEVVGVGRDWRLVGRAVLANYVCVPAVVRLGSAAPVPAPLVGAGQFPLVAAGFLVAAVCPGAPYGPPFTKMAGGDVVVSVGLMVLLAGSSAVLAPVLLHLLLPLTLGNQAVQIDAVRLAGILLFSQLLPLRLGLAMRQWRPALADRLKSPAGRLSLLLNLATLGLVPSQFGVLMGIPFKAFAGSWSWCSPARSWVGCWEGRAATAAKRWRWRRVCGTWASAW